MKNGDTIRLHQELIFEPVETLDFYPEDYPMDTIEDLRALVDRIEAEVPLPTVVNLYLPPVWYEEGLTLDGRPINLYGSVDEQNKRTAFLGPVAVTPENGSRKCGIPGRRHRHRPHGGGGRQHRELRLLRLGHRTAGGGCTLGRPGGLLV